MNVKAEQQTTAMDTIKLMAAIAILIGGIAAFYMFEAQSTLLRVIALLVITGVATAVALTSAQGKSLWSFATSARTEVRKVVWPSRQETLQTTLIVLFVVLLVGLFLWAVDGILGWILRSIVGTGG
ncbi:preprotein translocase subunit SecE [Solemya velum gill symbiont]|uniref:preprotein translocase subunit SecE n=1 Tax=Solemya velum gill symbiont TaxID=2340 RepID=UPI000998BA56|nr:preprotein translocase subunit SecE [Solemya velum gill symbiont]OOY50347.1 preprotein translocase subunit SecE [Solemya velum gill symbiont]OOY54487.1 preprotein translocase subunit SecE [Solemya velum gill symbiont]OOY54965.1 preprotein translocase subunit SecE [Solemya velum gill symbiont]OOY59168.1 preprotein translocase subunit SecE [Solemya velum gill symbiont]OOY60554.1 preprotein translocase subunit SecE [Solemya velum gill symbiont]